MVRVDVNELKPGFTFDDEQMNLVVDNLLNQQTYHDGVGATIAARDVHDRVLGIHNGPTYENPVPSSTHNRASQLPYHSLSKIIIEHVLRIGMMTRLNMSLTEIMTMEVADYIVMAKICTEQSLEEAKALTDLNPVLGEDGEPRNY